MSTNRLAMGTDIGRQVQLLNIFIEKRLNASLQKLGISLTGAQVYVLVYLHDHQDHTVTQKEIELAFQLSHPTIRGIVRRLVAAGMIETTPGSQDRRQVVLLLTPAGQQFLQEKLPALQGQLASLDHRLTADIDSREMATFMTVLNKMLNNVK